MRTLMIGILMLAFVVPGIVAETPWAPAGAVVVNGKKLEGVQYFKSGRRMVFPVLAIAAALGRKATFDAAARAVQWEGCTVATPTAVEINGTPYVAWKDLLRLESVLEYGVRSDAVVFSNAGRPKLSTPAASAPQGEWFTCSSHPDVKFRRGESCPKCGMHGGGGMH